MVAPKLKATPHDGGIDYRIWISLLAAPKSRYELTILVTSFGNSPLWILLSSTCWYGLPTMVTTTQATQLSILDTIPTITNILKLAFNRSIRFLLCRENAMPMRVELTKLVATGVPHWPGSTPHHGGVHACKGTSTTPHTATLEGVAGALMAPAPTAACPGPVHQKVGCPSQARGHGLGAARQPPSLLGTPASWLSTKGTLKCRSSTQ